MKKTGAVIVSWDFSNDKDSNVLLVGIRKNGVTEIINAYQGSEARLIAEMLFDDKHMISKRKFVKSV